MARFNLILLVLFLVSNLCLTGCRPKEPEKPVEVKVTVTESEESEGNKAAQYSGGMYQQFYDVTLEINEPPEFAGRLINLKAETRIGSSGQITAIGARLQFYIQPELIDREERCKLEDLIGYRYLEDE